MDAHILNEKLKLIQWLSGLEDVTLIKKLIQFKNNETEDFWETLSDEEKDSIRIGIDQAKNGELVPHSKAKELYEKWL